MILECLALFLLVQLWISLQSTVSKGLLKSCKQLTTEVSSLSNNFSRLVSKLACDHSISCFFFYLTDIFLSFLQFNPFQGVDKEDEYSDDSYFKDDDDDGDDESDDEPTGGARAPTVAKFLKENV